MEKESHQKIRVLVGIASLNDKDRYYSYLASNLTFVEAALQCVDHEVFVSPPSTKLLWAGLLECQNIIVEKFLSGDYSHLWLVELDAQVPPSSFQKLLGLDVDIACGFVRRHNGQGLNSRVPR